GGSGGGARGCPEGRPPAANPIVCPIAHPAVPALAQKIGNTRTAAAMELWRDRLGGSLVAIGNAPTALFHLLEMIDEGAPAPAAVIGLPVGFVGAAESKQALAAAGRLPFLIVRRRRGGSAMAVGAGNARRREPERLRMSALDALAGSAAPGTLYGIGVGPGDVRYLTLRAAALVQAVDLVAYFAKRGHVGNARRIVAPLLSAGRSEQRFEYPLTDE